MTLYYAFLANLNKGVVTVIWGLNPLFLSVIDYVVYRSPLGPRHIFVFISLILCGFFIAFSRAIELTLYGEYNFDTVGQALESTAQIRPAYIPVMFAIITPVGFSINAFLIKHLYNDLGFDPKRV